MVLKNHSVLVLCTKVASALEGLKLKNNFDHLRYLLRVRGEEMSRNNTQTTACIGFLINNSVVRPWTSPYAGVG